MNSKKMIVATATLCLMFACSHSAKEASNADSSITDGVGGSKNIEATPMNEPQINLRTEQEAKEGNGTEYKKGKESGGISEKLMIQKEIILSGTAKFQVENLDSATAAIESVVKAGGGLVSNATLESAYNSTLNRMVIRIPKDNFSVLVKQIMKQAIFINTKTIKSEDVTEEYVDIETRLKTKREVEQRYIDILRTKAKTVVDVLAAENELRVIHEEIEAKTGRLNYLKDQVAYSTFELEFYQVTQASSEPDRVTYSYLSEIKDAFSTGWKFFKNLFLGLIYIWPLYIIAFAIYRFIKYLIQRSRVKVTKQT